ncbi:MAG: CPBP family intramembrane metalloprotease [Chloroflexi bacterium]|nr:CPBP family intramembrane metalloprotease [Chloroflexota bacterium]
MSDSERKKTIWRVVIFLAVVMILTWVSPLLGGSPANMGPGFILWGMTPLLAAVGMRLATRDWADFGIKPGFKKNALWYVVSFIAIPILMLLALWKGVLTSITSISGFSLGEFLSTMLIALPIFFIFAIFEEVGWRDYLSPKLDSLGVNRFTASAIVAAIWATWHLPYITELTWAFSSGDLAVFLPRFYLVCFALSILYGELRSVSGTFWTAVLMHAVSNSFGHPLAAEYVTYAAGRELFADIGNGLIFIVLVSILGMAFNRWRSTRTTSRTPG